MATRRPHRTRTAAAVQAAIWFFSDRYVLNTSDPLHNTVVAIVDHIRAQGAAGPAANAHPHASPRRHLSGPAGQRAGAVHGHHEQPRRRHRRPGGRSHRHRHGRRTCSRTRQATVLGSLNGATVPSGTEDLDALHGVPPSRCSRRPRTAAVPTGNVYLYDGNARGPTTPRSSSSAADGHLDNHRLKPSAEFLAPARWS